MAGFYVTGVDNRPQPRYVGDAFVQADALEYVAEHGHEFDAIHASPPCQEYSVTRHLRDSNSAIFGYMVNRRPMMIESVRLLLIAAGKPWIIENVRDAPLPGGIMLCGSMFDLPIQRHRWFETSFLFFVPSPCRHEEGFYNLVGKKVRGYGKYASATRRYIDRSGRVRKGEGEYRKEIGQAAMGIDWMTINEMCEAIPPAYTRWIGQHLYEYVIQP